MASYLVLPECLFSLCAEVIYSNSAYQRVIGLDKQYKNPHKTSVPVVYLARCMINPGSNLPFAKKMYSFSNLISHWKGIILNKIKKIIKKLKIKLCRDALLSQSIHLIIWIKIIIYTQYVIIVYCFIMYYNTDVQIIATICNNCYK